MPDPCAALVHVAGNSSAVVAFYRSVALKLLNASNKQPGPPPSSSLSAAVPSLCELVDVRGMASGLRLRSFDPDLFHTDTAEALKRQAERRYKARVIPLIAPVVAYFPPQTGETAPEAISARVEAAMRQHQLWLRHDEGDRCVVLNESLWPGPDVPPEADDVRVVLKVLTYKRASSLQVRRPLTNSLARILILIARARVAEADPIVAGRRVRRRHGQPGHLRRLRRGRER
jgi:hypothetical protein